jgi:hypothetical protein
LPHHQPRVLRKSQSDCPATPGVPQQSLVLTLAAEIRRVASNAARSRGSRRSVGRQSITTADPPARRATRHCRAGDMLHGNWLLRGWTLGDVTYYSTEIPEYALVEMSRGLGAGKASRRDSLHLRLRVASSLS